MDLPVLPTMSNAGSPRVFSTSETSCYRCIRVGGAWCSTVWRYEETGATYNAANEKGNCCYEVSSKAKDLADNTKA